MLCHFKLPMQVDFLASVETPIVTAGSEEAPEAIVMLTPYLAADRKKPAQTTCRRLAGMWRRVATTTAEI
jgi:hypothetical protein